MINKRELIDNLYTKIIQLNRRIDRQSEDIKNLPVPMICKECGVYFKAGTGKNIGWTNIYPFSYGPVSGTYHYCSWCQPGYDRTEFSLATREKDPSWKYFKCEEVELETTEHES